MSKTQDAAGIETDARFTHVWEAASSALLRVNDSNYYNGYKIGPHFWWTQIRRSFHLHPLIKRLVNAGYRPRDWQQMLLEWPHISMDDETQIAYTRNEEAGLDFLANGSKRQTRTPIGKYISRHYPHVPDHVRRDWMLLFKPATYAIWESKELIISAIELGPQSCMKSSYGSIPFSTHDNSLLCAWQKDKSVRVDWDSHPYAVYAPEYGWKMAVRLDSGKPDIVMGRALINGKEYVRSYRRGDSEHDYSHTDDKLEAWLNANGYYKSRRWPDGTQVRKLDYPGSTRDAYMMPYLDGDTQTCEVYGDHIEITRSGSFTAGNTDGSLDGGIEPVGSCEDCSARVYEGEDYRWVGRSDDVLVCDSCSEDYRYARGAGGRWSNYREYYTHEDNAVEIDGEWYDTDNLPNNVVYCEDSEYRLREDCVEVEGEWYERDNEDVVQCADGVYRLRADCWESAQGNWYSESEPCVSVDRGDYHPDELQELIDNA